MTNYLKFPLKMAFVALSLCLFITSCGKDDGSGFETPDTSEPTDPETPEPMVATIVFNEGDESSNVTSAEASGEAGGTVSGRVIFTATDNKQKRMYITQNISGQGDMPFGSLNLTSDNFEKELNRDGSIDLDGETRMSLDFTFELPVPQIDNGQIVYKFWTTRGKGDFRDTDKRLALGVGTITVSVGTGTNAAAEVRNFTNVKLFAPAQDGTTESFFSFLNEEVYRINEGPEFRAFWDFGYYYGASGVSDGNDASFASTATYDASFGFEVEGLAPGADEDDMENETLNQTFFNTSTRTTADFDGITLSGELDAIVASEVEKITNLAVGDVIEFVDNYGKKGLIKITEIEAGFNTNDFIIFDVKIQP